MLSDDNSKWLCQFRKIHGRAPRILHIGNIANNAYNNAKILNEDGLDCDVICYDYYHIMGCPEWEDADFEGEITDQFRPDWTEVNLKGFERPRWFAQGPVMECIEYLIARREGNLHEINHLWKKMSILNGSRQSSDSPFREKLLQLTTWIESKKSRLIHGLLYLATGSDIAFRISSRCYTGRLACFTKSEILRLFIVCNLIAVALLVRIFSFPFRKLIKLQASDVNESKNNSFDDRVAELVSVSAKIFPVNVDSLTAGDMEKYRSLALKWNRLISHYDFVVGYSTDGILPLLCSKSYAAYEHGTIRSLPFQQTPEGRICALSYIEADHVFITNADNVKAAKALNLKSYSFVPHPVNEDYLQPDSRVVEIRDQLRRQLSTDFIILHPSRQHWDKTRHPDWEKGNDVFIIGLARFIHEVDSHGSAVLVEWGQKVAESKALIEDLGISDRVLWVPPLPNREMVRYIHATDALADQFFLGAFGSTTPKALACGKPVLLNLDEELHRWCFAELPPVINVSTPDEVFHGLKRLYEDREWALSLSERGQEWYEKYHSNKVIVERLMDGYSRAIESHERRSASI